MSRLVFVFISSFLLSGCSLLGGNKAGIQITTNPQANVTLDGKSLGQTPVYQEDVKVGSYDINIERNDKTLVPW
ncbi:PEGA domain-containing protein, partial [Candidatus Collierbacteria bacterium]|nr:PEGA domain-containing protein [Candidatus Collierbacteria bacterium]